MIQTSGQFKEGRRARRFALTRALRARPPEVAENLTENLAENFIAALQPRAQRA